MSLGINLFRKRPRHEAHGPPTECSHWELAPRWDSATEIGDPERISHYLCTSCGETVSPAEGLLRAAFATNPRC